MPDTGTDTSLAWVTFTDQHPDEECCYHDCSSQATHMAWFWLLRGNCPHLRRAYCVFHRDLILRAAAQLNQFTCRRICGPGSLLMLLGMEPLR